MIWRALFVYAHLLAAGLAGGLLLAEYWMLARPLDRRQLRLLATVDMGYLLALIAVVATGLARASIGAGLQYYLGNRLFLLKLGILGLVAVAAVAATVRIVVWSREVRVTAFAPLTRDVERLRAVLGLQLGCFALLPLPAVLVSRGFGG